MQINFHFIVFMLASKFNYCFRTNWATTTIKLIRQFMLCFSSTRLLLRYTLWAIEWLRFVCVRWQRDRDICASRRTELSHTTYWHRFNLQCLAGWRTIGSRSQICVPRLCSRIMDFSCLHGRDRWLIEQPNNCHMNPYRHVYVERITLVGWHLVVDWLEE